MSDIDNKTRGMASSPKQNPCPWDNHLEVVPMKNIVSNVNILFDLSNTNSPILKKITSNNTFFKSTELII